MSITAAPLLCLLTRESVVCPIESDAVGMSTLVEARERRTEDVCDDVRLKYCSFRLIAPKNMANPRTRRTLVKMPPIRVVWRMEVRPCTKSTMHDTS